MRNKVIGTVLAGTLAMSAAVFGTGTPALAASRSDKCVAWACGSATFTFSGDYRLRAVSMSIKDPACNGSNAYVRLRVHYFNGSHTGPKRFDTTNNSACDNVYKTYTGLAFNGGDQMIRGVEVFVGDAANGVAVGNYVDNPNT